MKYGDVRRSLLNIALAGRGCQTRELQVPMPRGGGKSGMFEEEQEGRVAAGNGTLSRRG